MDSNDSHVSLSEQRSDSIPTQFPNPPFAPFNIPLQPNSQFDPYFSHYKYPYDPRYSYQALLSTPNIQMDNTQVCSLPKKQKTKVRNTQNSSSQSTNPNWSKAEDVALTKAYLYVSGDTDVGNGQKSPAMWNRIFEAWKENMGAECNDFRNTNSLGCRWQKVREDVTKFQGFYEGLVRGSGTTPDDMKREAMRIFEDIKGRTFKFEHCWDIMKTNPKWCASLLTKTNVSKKRQSNNVVNTTKTYENVVNLGDEVKTPDSIGLDEVERPQGRKGCKDKKRRLNQENGVVDALKSLHCTLEKQVEVNQKQMELREEAVRKDLELKDITQKIKIKDQELRERTQKRKEQHRVMNQDLSKLTPAVRQTYEIYQAKILKEWENDGLFGNDSVRIRRQTKPSNSLRLPLFEQEVEDCHGY